ncbi:MAG: O-antigen ligase family protein [Patescibacteria group bacterium]
MQKSLGKSIIQNKYKYSFYVLLLLLTLGQVVGIKLNVGHLYAYDIFAIVLALTILLHHSLNNALRGFTLFIGVAIISLVANYQIYTRNELLFSAFYLIRYVAYLVLANFFILKLELNTINRGIKVFAYMLVLTGILQLIFLPNLSTLDSSLGWDPHINRLSGALLDPNFMGAALGIILIYLVFEQISRVELGLISGAIILTFSRSAWLLLSTCALFYGILKNVKIIFFAILIAFLAYFAVPRIQTRLSTITDPADSAQYRLESWAKAINIAKDRPFVGYGFNGYRFIQKEYGYLEPGTLGDNDSGGSDASLLLVLATTGIIGLLSLIYGYTNAISSSKNRLVIFIITSALIINSFFINSLFYPQIMFVYFLLVGLLEKEKVRKI